MNDDNVVEIVLGSREHIKTIVLGHFPDADLDTMEIDEHNENGELQINVRVRRKPDAQTVNIAIVRVPEEGGP